jgi:hypothetical protein
MIMNIKKWAFGFCALAVASFSSAQTAEEVVAKYISAKGGADNLRKIQTVVMKGTLNANGLEIPINSYVIGNKAYRQDFTVNGMTGYQIITKENGWNFNPFMGQTKAEAMTADDIKSSLDQLDATDDLLDYAAKGTGVEYLGTEDVEGTECYKLKLTMSSGKEKTYFIATADNMLVKTSQKVNANGQEVETSTMMSNYKEVNGVLFPYSISVDFGPLEIENIEINVPVDESLFQPE